MYECDCDVLLEKTKPCSALIKPSLETLIKLYFIFKQTNPNYRRDNVNLERNILMKLRSRYRDDNANTKALLLCLPYLLYTHVLRLVCYVALH